MLRAKNKKLIWFSVVVLLAISGAATAVHFIHPTPDRSPFSKTVKRSVIFPLYYPTVLPAGYWLDKSSISTTSSVVIYSVKYSGGAKKMVFSLHAQPTADQISSFYFHYMPLHIDVSTTVGTAAIGAINNHTVVSLPTDKTWILLTGPPDVNQSLLRQIIESLTKVN